MSSPKFIHSSPTSQDLGLWPPWRQGSTGCKGDGEGELYNRTRVPLSRGHLSIATHKQERHCENTGRRAQTEGNPANVSSQIRRLLNEEKIQCVVKTTSLQWFDVPRQSSKLTLVHKSVSNKATLSQQLPNAQVENVQSAGHVSSPKHHLM